MELRHLRYFVAVAEAENVSRAALKLRVSQPALSRQIRDLEDELGFALLERSAKSIRLTEAGRVFLTEARGALERVSQAVAAARSVAGGRSELHIGYAPTLTARVLPRTLREFQKAAPNARVKLHDLSTEEMITGLREGKLQLMFGARPPRTALRQFAFEEVTREPVRLLVAPTHPLARRRSVSVAEAAKHPQIAYSRREYPDYHDLLAEVYRGLKMPPIAEEHDGVSSLISALEAGSGVALGPESMSCMAGPRLKLLSLEPAPSPLVIGITSPTAGSPDAAVRFVQCARSIPRDRD